MDMHTFFTWFEICALWVVVSWGGSSAADYRYEECGPRNCGAGPNISFPFYINGRHQSYCGYPAPGFRVNCSDNGFPMLQLGESDYVVEDIFYQTRTLRVINSAVMRLNSSDCVPRIRNTSLATTIKFNYAENVTNLHFFSNCSESLPLNVSRARVCDERGGGDWALYDKDENIADALDDCGTNLVAPVEDDHENVEGRDLIPVLERGFVINWTASNCSDCVESGGHCGFNEAEFVFKCFCEDRPHSRSCKPEKQSKMVLAAAISGGGVFILLCLLFSLIIWRCKKRLINYYLISRNKSCRDPRLKSDIENGKSYFGTHIFSYKELLEATNNFDSSKELGDGGFGTVYYGKLRDGREVAVKHLYERSFRRVEQFMNEIKILTKLRHKNLVSLYGCTSRQSRELLLVYEYVSNGTVADHLHGEGAKEAPLTWPVRLKIAIETASALAYLHKSDIIHRDVKTNNILLDDNYSVKVADFGLSRLFPNDVTHISTAPQGTPGYVDPDYHQCYQLTEKSDVYSFGVVLMELVSSMPAVDISRHTSEINLASLAVNRIQRSAFDELVDSSLGYKTDADVLRMTTSVAELAFRCLQLEKDVRPSMDEVLNYLKEIQGGEGAIEAKTGMIPPSPETDDVILLKNKKFESSPNAVSLIGG